MAKYCNRKRYTAKETIGNCERRSVYWQKYCASLSVRKSEKIIFFEIKPNNNFRRE